jgi:hypothetical protein
MSEQGRIVRRSIGIVFADGGLLALTSTLPDGAPVQFEEALLSTEYGEDGVQRRASLELWPDVEDMRPLRGAGTLISSVRVRRQGLDSEIAFFRWAVEGREGLGTYEVARNSDG